MPVLAIPADLSAYLLVERIVRSAPGYDRTVRETNLAAVRKLRPPSYETTLARIGGKLP